MLEAVLNRELHTERDTRPRKFTHVDGKIVRYLTETYGPTASRPRALPGPYERKRKLWRVDGPMSDEQWMEVVGLFFRGNNSLASTSRMPSPNGCDHRSLPPAPPPRRPAQTRSFNTGATSRRTRAWGPQRLSLSAAIAARTSCRSIFPFLSSSCISSQSASLNTSRRRRSHLAPTVQLRPPGEHLLVERCEQVVA